MNLTTQIAVNDKSQTFLHLQCFSISLRKEKNKIKAKNKTSHCCQFQNKNAGNLPSQQNMQSTQSAGN